MNYVVKKLKKICGQDPEFSSWEVNLIASLQQCLAKVLTFTQSLTFQFQISGKLSDRYQTGD